MKRVCIHLAGIVAFALLMQGLLRLSSVLPVRPTALGMLDDMTVFDGLPYVAFLVSAALVSFLLDISHVVIRRPLRRITLDVCVIAGLLLLSIVCRNSGIGDGTGGALLGLLIAHWVILLVLFRGGVTIVEYRMNRGANKTLEASVVSAPQPQG
ncbi:MAG: hypothetical protein GX595_10655 [Lentisphaerae bacterium]|nr:hypothetical protein [Lentisphaerota bacterium]